MADLLVDGIHTAYGLSQVRFGVSLEVHAGECIALIGRNGVGKTTTMRSIIGLTPPASGRVVWKGRDIARLGPHRICRLGIGFVPEDRRIFPELTVWENLDIARRAGRAEPAVRDGARRPRLHPGEGRGPLHRHAGRPAGRQEHRAAVPDGVTASGRFRLPLPILMGRWRVGAFALCAIAPYPRRRG